MRTWSLRVLRIFGVDLRLHLFLILLLGLLLSYAGIAGASGKRGVVLWCILVFAIAVRETARGIVSAALGLELRSIQLLPLGGLPTYATTEATELANSPRVETILALTGPLANLLAALVLAGIIASATPQIDLLHRAWLSPLHLLRALVWMNLVLVGVHLLPAFPLDAGRLVRSIFDRTEGSLKSARAAAILSQSVAGVLILLGFLRSDIWLIVFGASIFLAATSEGQALLLRSDVDAVLMRDVMLTEFSTLSASDTLEDALSRSIHTLQDVFPVVRGPRLVGSVSRQSIVEALQSSGNAYLQGIMTRNFPTAQPSDSLVKTLRRIVAGRGAQLVPVIEAGRVVGIITPQNLAQSMALLEQHRRHTSRDSRSPQD